MEEKWLKKLHTAGSLKELRVQGITKRWVINILGVIALFFVIVFVVSAFTIRAYYYNAVESILNSGASTTAITFPAGWTAAAPWRRLLRTLLTASATGTRPPFGSLTMPAA